MAEMRPGYKGGRGQARHSPHSGRHSAGPGSHLVKHSDNMTGQVVRVLE